MKREIESLRPGTLFRFGSKKGKLVRLTPGAAVVDLIIAEPRLFRTRDGRDVKIARRSKRTIISRATPVEVGR